MVRIETDLLIFLGLEACLMVLQALIKGIISLQNSIIQLGRRSMKKIIPALILSIIFIQLAFNGDIILKHLTLRPLKDTYEN